ncbi:hypothetical protein H6P81_019813 [Aristolochia fimbriata]|uniref:Uncharacterized protein n=1 Tax=Aristolochia fimbriata TaxID=158543 RepID=A0AAV7DTR0_ARIFI|nr:hypothetical protein H6P81_019813 [Aristolochia fimbriata]
MAKMTKPPGEYLSNPVPQQVESDLQGSVAEGGSRVHSREVTLPAVEEEAGGGRGRKKGPRIEVWPAQNMKERDVGMGSFPDKKKGGVRRAWPLVATLDSFVIEPGHMQTAKPERE